MYHDARSSECQIRCTLLLMTLFSISPRALFEMVASVLTAGSASTHPVLPHLPEDPWRVLNSFTRGQNSSFQTLFCFHRGLIYDTQRTSTDANFSI